MRRSLVVVLLTVLTVASASGAADARSLKVRIDANDSTSNLDIHKVITDLSNTKVYLRLNSWQRFRAWDVADGGWGFLLDTYGSSEFDRWVEIIPQRSSHRFDCLVEDWHDGSLIGSRDARRPNERSAACTLPRRWFGHIHRAVRFEAFIEFPSSRRHRDEAPGHDKRYRWI